MQSTDSPQIYQLLQVGRQLLLWPQSRPAPSHAASRLGMPLEFSGLVVTLPWDRQWIRPRGQPTTLLEVSGEPPQCSLEVAGHRYQIAPLSRPTWAHEFGRDRFGLYADLRVQANFGSPVQRFRWIEPGTFLMGSPSTEWERHDNEGPQHTVTLTAGFWLADTACTLALWQAVMGKEHGELQGSDQLPVSTVDWNEAMGFMHVLGELLHGPEWSLPTEAQWEYAFRAGTATPFSFGASITSGLVNYHPNAGANGGKVPVKTQPPNPWGLHEMQGNVWEWCADGMRQYTHDAVTDPFGPMQDPFASGPSRAVRGGSRSGGAWAARSTGRNHFVPDYRDSYLGFRLCSMSSSSPDLLLRKALKYPFDRGSGRSATAPKTLIFATSLHAMPDRQRFPHAFPPPFASAWGDDAFGLFVDIELTSNNTAASPPIQRLRWIEPGSFLMGSPENEPGRYPNEGPQHQVTLTQGFWLADTACTQALWSLLMGTNPSQFQQDAQQPVEKVSWHDVRTFLLQLTNSLPECEATLPTWEYACRAGTRSAFSFGDSMSRQQVNHRATVEVRFLDWGSRPVPVKSLPPNPWGLYEMHGNVWEWCADGLRSYATSAVVDPIGPRHHASTPRAVRGGSWVREARGVRSADRVFNPPELRRHDIGFRFVLNTRAALE